MTLSGNLTRDPELRQLPSGASVCSLRIAANERTKNPNTQEWEDRPMFFNATIFKGTGEYVARTLHKGDEVTVAGRLRWREWQQEDVRREAVEIVADSIVGRPRNPDAAAANTQDAPIDTADLPQPQPVQSAAPVEDDDIPF